MTLKYDTMEFDSNLIYSSVVHVFNYYDLDECLVIHPWVTCESVI